MSRDMNYANKILAGQVARLEKLKEKIDNKLQETKDYLDGNKRKAILVNYWEPMNEHGGGFKFENEYDFTYIGDKVFTKYADTFTVKGYDEEKDLISFEETDKKLGSSRISYVGLDKNLKDYSEDDHEHKYESDGAPCIKCGQTVAQLIVAQTENLQKNNEKQKVEI